MHLSIETEPVHSFFGLCASSDGRVALRDFPVLFGRIDPLPKGIRALVVTSDLQGRECGRGEGEARLLGEAFAEEIEAWIAANLEIPPAEIAVVLPGDLWSFPVERAKRGGYGDVRPVWNAFAQRFARVFGVPGNHDLFGPAGSVARAESWSESIDILDCGAIEWGGVRFGGVGGCVGNRARPFRYEASVQTERLRTVARLVPEILILHQGPPIDGRPHKGSIEVEEALRALGSDTIVFCGHEAWVHRLHRVGNARVLNVHESVCVLLGPNEPSPRMG
jgi:Icc-related predicted phosphoesterase